MWDLFTTCWRFSFCLFSGGAGGRSEHAVWQADLFLLSWPDNVVLPPTTQLGEGQKYKVQDSARLDFIWITNFVCQSYPDSRLNLVGFYFASMSKGRNIKQLHVRSVRQLKADVGKIRIYIVPGMRSLRNHVVVSKTGCSTNNAFPSITHSPQTTGVPGLPLKRQLMSPRQTGTALCGPNWVISQLSQFLNIAGMRVYTVHRDLYHPPVKCVLSVMFILTSEVILSAFRSPPSAISHDSCLSASTAVDETSHVAQEKKKYITADYNYCFMGFVQ